MADPRPIIDDQTLLAHANGEPCGDLDPEVAARLAADASAARLVDLWRMVRDALRAEASEGPSAEAWAGVLAIHRRGRAGTRPLHEVLASVWGQVRQVVAEVVHDSRRDLAFAGLRGEQMGAGFHLACRGEGAIVDLQCEPAARDPEGLGRPRWRLVGQVDTEDPRRRRWACEILVVAEGGDVPLAELRTDEFGTFSCILDPLPCSVYVRLSGGSAGEGRASEPPLESRPESSPGSSPEPPRGHPVLRIGPLDLTLP